MNRYGKLNSDGRLIILPRNYVTESGTTICNFNLLDKKEWKKHGFKPIIECEKPEGMCYPVYTDLGYKITIEWKEIEDDTTSV